MPVKQTSLHREDIKALVRKRGISLKRLSLQSGLCADACGHSLDRPIPAANKAIAKLLNLNMNAIWPDWYDQSDNRRSINVVNHKSKRPLVNKKQSVSKVPAIKRGAK